MSFRTFLSHPLRCWHEIWYTTLSWHDADPVPLLSCLTYFSLSYCSLQKLSFPNFLSRLLWFWCINLSRPSILVKITFCHVWPTFYWVIPLYKKLSFPDFSLPTFVISTWNLVYEFIFIYTSQVCFCVWPTFTWVIAHCYNFNFIAFRDIDLDVHIWIFLDVMHVNFNFCHVWPNSSSVIARCNLCNNLVFLGFLSRLLWYWLEMWYILNLSRRNTDHIGILPCLT